MINFVILMLGMLLASSLASIVIPKIRFISLRKRLFDQPDRRKVHKRPVSRLGGVSFFPVILFTVTLLAAVCGMRGGDAFVVVGSNSQEILLLCSGLTLLYMVGIADDLVGMRYRHKFLVQFFAASMLASAGLYIDNLYGLFGIHSVIPHIGIPLTLLLVIFITNALNLIDGIDGLASGLSIVALLVYGYLFAICGLWLYSLLACATIGVLLPFFYYNVFGNADRGRKIFMGDTGSLTLGFLLSFFTIKYTMDLSTISVFDKEGAILVAFSILLVPCLDVIRVVLGRVRRKRSPFLPDKTHIHHKFLELGFTPRKAMVIILAISFLFSLSNILLVKVVDNTLLFVLDVVVWTVMNMYISREIARKSKV